MYKEKEIKFPAKWELYQVKSTFVVFLCSIMMILCLSGCKNETLATEKVRDIEFTVLLDDGIPVEFLTIIEEKKEAPFKLTFSDGEFLYIAVGYGMQLTCGYSIQVNQLYLTANAVYCDTSLMGPTSEEDIKKAASYPYIVLKMENMDDKTVVFE